MLEGSFLNFLTILLLKASYMFLNCLVNEFSELASKVKKTVLISRARYNVALSWQKGSESRVQLPSLSHLAEKHIYMYFIKRAYMHLHKITVKGRHNVWDGQGTKGSKWIQGSSYWILITTEGFKNFQELRHIWSLIWQYTKIHHSWG